jgi:hypothetical protein
MECIGKYLDQKFQIHTPSGVIYQFTVRRGMKRLDSEEMVECRSVNQEERNDLQEERRNKFRLPSIVQLET